MNPMQQFHNCSTCWLTALAIGVLPKDAAAYIDPGTTGVMSQVLYVLFYGVLGMFFYSLRFIKGWVARTKTYVAKLCGQQL